MCEGFFVDFSSHVIFALSIVLEPRAFLSFLSLSLPLSLDQTLHGLYGPNIKKQGCVCVLLVCKDNTGGLFINS